MSGHGDVHAAVVREPIDAARFLGGFASSRDGAVLLFLGIVRDHNEGRAVEGVGYEAYEEMARPVLLDIAREASARLDGGRVAVEHRVGEFRVGEVSVAIAVCSAHRSAAYEASRHVIEEIKRRLPVWKHERYAEGDARWLEGQTPEPEPADSSAARDGAGKDGAS